MPNAGIGAANRQARNTEAITRYNYAIAQQQAEQQAQLAQYQTAQNQQLADAQAQGLRNQAIGVRQQIEAGDARAREDVRRRRERLVRFKGTQRARAAASGVVVGAGTPLDILAETAGRIELALSEVHAANEAERRTLGHRATLLEQGANIADIASGQVALRGRVAQSRHRVDLQNAEIARLSGLDRASGQRSAGTATLLTGASSLFGSAQRFRYQGAIGNA